MGKTPPRDYKVEKGGPLWYRNPEKDPVPEFEPQKEGKGKGGMLDKLKGRLSRRKSSIDIPPSDRRLRSADKIKSEDKDKDADKDKDSETGKDESSKKKKKDSSSEKKKKKD